MGMGGDKILPRLLGIDPDGEEGKAISERRKEIFKQSYLRKLRAFPRTRELLQRMRADGLALIVASSAKADELAPLLELAGAADLVSDRVSSDDVERSKPDPDIVVAAVVKAEVRPDQAVMLGDTPYDLEAARGAGVGLIALRAGGWRDDAFPNALAVYDDPADLLAKYDASLLSGR